MFQQIILYVKKNYMSCSQMVDPYSNLHFLNYPNTQYICIYIFEEKDHKPLTKCHFKFLSITNHIIT